MDALLTPSHNKIENIKARIRPSCDDVITNETKMSQQITLNQHPSVPDFVLQHISAIGLFFLL